MYPVLLSQPLMILLLKPDEMEHLWNAWRVGRGIKLIVKAIGRNIRESDEATQRAKFEKMWLLGRRYDESWTVEDSSVYPKLMAEFEEDTRIRGRNP
jgi:hypothetical protein